MSSPGAKHQFMYRAFIGRRLYRNAIHGYYHVVCDSDDCISLSEILAMTVCRRNLGGGPTAVVLKPFPYSQTTHHLSPSLALRSSSTSNIAAGGR